MSPYARREADRGERPLKLGFDLDGVLTHTDTALLRDMQARGLCRGRTVDELRHYYWSESFPEISDALVAEVLETPGFYQELAPVPQLVETARRTVAAGHELHIVTARLGPPHVAEETRAWLHRHRIPFHRLEFVPAWDKFKYVDTHGLHLFVEDRFDTANRIAQQVPVLLVSAPYNTPQEHGRGPLHGNVVRLPREHVVEDFPVLLGIARLFATRLPQAVPG